MTYSEVEQLGKGECFGERALGANHDIASATVLAIEPTIAMTIAKEEYFMACEWLDSSGGWDEQMMQARLRNPSAVASMIAEVCDRNTCLSALRMDVWHNLRTRTVRCLSDSSIGATGQIF